MITKIKAYKPLQFEERKIYQTKFQTGEKFLLTKIIWKTIGEEKEMFMFNGIFENHKHLGVCPLNIDRLIPEMIEDGEIEICNICKAKI